MGKYLDDTGLTYFWSKVKDRYFYASPNCIPFPYEFEDGRVHRGITAHIHEDGTVTFTGVNSTSNASTYQLWSRESQLDNPLPAGYYKLSGCPEGGSSTTYRIRLRRQRVNETNYGDQLDIGSGKIFELDGTQTCDIIIACRGVDQATTEAFTFKPMLQKVEDSSGTGALEYSSQYQDKITVTKGEMYDIERRLAALEAAT